MYPPVSLPLLGRPESPRLVARLSVRVRREGGSLSMTIPRHIVRHWKLEPGARLVVRSTDEGVLLYPRYFWPYVERGWMPVDTDDEFEDGDRDGDEPRQSVLTAEEAPPATAR